MKWHCAVCKAINPEFCYRCHNCGLDRIEQFQMMESFRRALGEE